MTIRRTLRSLQRTPAFTSAVLLTLLLGIASVGSMFAIVYGVLLAPLPYGEPDRLVSVGLRAGAQHRMQQPPALFAIYSRFAQSLDSVGFYRIGNANIWIAGDDAAPERVTATWVTASMMPLLQAPPMLGRSFSADEERPEGPHAVVLSESVWRTRYAASTDVIGKTLMVNSIPREIVGVMPARFAFPTADTRVWLPVRTGTEPIVDDFAYSGVARLAPGATAVQAQRDLVAILPKLADFFPYLASGSSTVTWLDEAGPTPVVVSLREELTGSIARTLWMLAAAAGLVLIVALANAANLMLIRADGRQSELAVREALGANRLHMATRFLGETLLLGAAAGVLALLVAYGAVRALVAFGPADIPRLAELGVKPATAGFVLLVTAVVVVVCAAVPAGCLGRASLSTRLRDGGHGDSTGKAGIRLRSSITTLQIALALVVTVGSALLLRTAYRLAEVHPGFDTAGDYAVVTTAAAR